MREERGGWCSTLAVVSACFAMAVAAWLVPASVRIVQWPDAGPVRLALLSPTWQLAAWLVLAAVVAAVVLWRGSEWTRDMAPLSLLWLWTVPFLPWLPDRLPLLLVLGGPIRWILLAVALVLLCRRFLPVDSLTTWLAGLSRRAIFAISLVVYVGFGAYSAMSLSTGGDEPHYLVITESLIRDGDLQIENNHQRRDYLPFFQGNLRPDFFVRGQNGQIYSIHPPGLPVLALPAYYVAGRMGVVVLVAVIAALTALAMFDLSVAVAGRGAGVAAWAGCCLTVPFVPYAWLIFPEMPGALLVAWASRWVLDTQGQTGGRPRSDPSQPLQLAVWCLRGALLATLPWLHTKFVVFLAVFAAALGWKLLAQRARLVAFGLPIALSTAAWLYSFYAIYGVFNPEAPYGAYSATYVLTKYIPHGLLGIFFDQKFGLLPYSPLYLCAIPGAWFMWRRADTRFLLLVLAVAVGAFVASTARLYMFWGGTSAPARFLVPILPCLAPMVALGMSKAHTALTRALVGAWMTVGLAFGVMGMGWPTRLLLFSVDHGRSRVLELIQDGAPLAMSIPTFTEPDWLREVPAFGVWLAVALTAVTVASWTSRRSQSAWGALGVACAVFGIGGAILSAQPSAAARADAVRRGALDTIWRFDGTRFRTLDYSTLTRVSQERLVELTSLDVTRQPAGQATLVADVLALPAGAYEAQVAFASNAHVPGDLRISDPPSAEYARLESVSGLSARLPFVLPMAARRLTITASSPELAEQVRQVTLVPRSVVPPGEREPLPVRVLESIPNRPSALLGYTDEHAYPEQGVFWSRGTARTRVFLAPAGFSRLTLTLSTGPMNARVRLSVGSEDRVVSMTGGREAQETFELPPNVRIVPISVESSAMFRPAEVDPASTDRRGLGCQVRIGLE